MAQLRIAFLEMMSRQWEFGSCRFETTYCPHFQGSKCPREYFDDWRRG